MVELGHIAVGVASKLKDGLVMAEQGEFEKCLTRSRTFSTPGVCPTLSRRAMAHQASRARDGGRRCSRSPSASKTFAAFYRRPSGRSRADGGAQSRITMARRQWGAFPSPVLTERHTDS